MPVGALRLELLLVLIWACQWEDVMALSDGPPVAACDTLSPDPTAHSASPQTGLVPYMVDLSELTDDSGSLSYVPGETYQCM